MLRQERKITRDALVEMMGSEDALALCVRTAFCGRKGCGTATEIADYEENIFINDLGDTILRVKCIRCGQLVNRYIETGEM